MQNLVNKYLAKFKKQHQLRRRFGCIMLVLALIVGTTVYWQLKLTGAALTNETYCGKTEHQHDESCYEYVLICGLEEGQLVTVSETESEGETAETTEGAAEASESTSETTEAATETEAEGEMAETTEGTSETSESTSETTEAATETETTGETAGTTEGTAEASENTSETTEAVTEPEITGESPETTEDVSETTEEVSGAVEKSTEIIEEATETSVESTEISETAETSVETAEVLGATIEGTTETATGTTTDTTEGTADTTEETADTTEAADNTGTTTTVHVHTEACYEKVLVCGLEEHTHSVACLSDITADVETDSDWEVTIPADLGTDWAEAVVAVAESQLGYTESTANYILADDGETLKGYTRYGAWAGNEYGDWDAMFASFCLSYAGISTDDFPESTGAYAWAVKLQEAGLYADAAEYTPAAGDLVFFDTDSDGRVDSVGIISDIDDENNTLTVIEGDYANNDGVDAVVENTYASDDSMVVGYGVLPEADTSAGIATIAGEESASAGIATVAGEVTAAEAGITVSALSLGATALSADAQAVYDMFLALPDEDDFAAMTTQEELIDAYNQLKAAYDAWNALSTSDERNAVNSALYDYTGKYTTYTYKNNIFALFMNRWMDTQGSMDLYDYMDYANGVGFETGLTYSFETDDGTAVEPDSDGVYTLSVDEIYNVNVKVNFDLIYDGSYTFTLPEGILMNTETLDLPRNMGTVDFDGANHRLTFNITGDQYNGYVEADVAFRFTKKGTYPFFEDEPEVVITAEPLEETGVNKTGSYNSISDGKLNWEVVLTGQKHSVLVGTPIVDEITTTSTHYYSDADRTNGITITATDTGTGETYTWTVYENSNGMAYWTETGWSYTIPETVTLDNGDTLILPTYGGTGWVLVLEYTSTISDSFDADAITVFHNTVTMEGSDEGSVIYMPTVGIEKYGKFCAGETYEDSYVEWTITTYIPGMAAGTSVNQVYLCDNPIQLQKDGSIAGYLVNTWDELTITATIGGITYDVMPLTEANAAAGYPILYTTTSATQGNGRSYIYFYTPCDCDSESGSTACANVNGRTGKCGTTSTHKYEYCQCWDITDDVTITVTFQTSALATSGSSTASTTLGEYVLYNNSALDYTSASYSAVTYSAYNQADIRSGKFYDGTAGFSESTTAYAAIEQVFSKARTSASSGVAYEISFNAHVADSADVKWEDMDEIVITDTMSENMTIDLDSIEIIWENEDGTDSGTLDTSQYTVEYATEGYTYSAEGASLGTGSNIVTFTISDVGDHYQYYIRYAVDVSGNSGDAYTNVAQMTVNGVLYYTTKQLKFTVSVSAAAQYYSVTLIKVDEEDTTKLLENATYQLYEYVNGTWSLLTTAMTGTDGTLLIHTDRTAGIILRQHRLYYFIETDEPVGYVLDDTKHYFWFCGNHGEDGNGGDCPICQQLIRQLTAMGVSPEDYTAPRYASTASYTGSGNPVGLEIDLTFTNEVEPYSLPETGGTGTLPYALSGMALCGGTGLALFRRWRRRGVPGV